MSSDGPGSDIQKAVKRLELEKAKLIGTVCQCDDLHCLARIPAVYIERIDRIINILVSYNDQTAKVSENGIQRRVLVDDDIIPAPIFKHEEYRR